LSATGGGTLFGGTDIPVCDGRRYSSVRVFHRPIAHPRTNRGVSQFVTNQNVCATECVRFRIQSFGFSLPSRTLPPCPTRSKTNGWLDPHLSQEWLLTNGIGSFASSTILACNTRRYHGLLCAATNPPVGRIMTLNRVAEILIFDGDNEQADRTLHQPIRPTPAPARRSVFARNFRLRMSPRWEYAVRDGELVKELLALLEKKNTIAIRYTWTGPKTELQILPFVSLRDFHSLPAGGITPCTPRAASDRSAVTTTPTPSICRPTPANSPSSPIVVRHTYAIEQNRGQDFSEDLYTPGRFTIAWRAARR